MLVRVGDQSNLTAEVCAVLANANPASLSTRWAVRMPMSCGNALLCWPNTVRPQGAGVIPTALAGRLSHLHFFSRA